MPLRRVAVLGRVTTLLIAVRLLMPMPASADQALRDRAYMAEPRLRIQLVERTAEITLTTADAARLVFGDGHETEVRAGARLVLALRDARAPMRRYGVGVGSFPQTKLAEAQAAAERWRQQGYTVRLVPVGQRFTTRSGDVLVDTRSQWVVLGETGDERAAKELERRLQRKGSGTWLVSEIVRPAQGRIEVRSKSGAVLDSGPAPLRVVSPEPVEVANVAFGLGFWGRGHREHRRFPGILVVDATDGGMLTLRNDVGMEDYIRGVVPAEISLKAPLEAMAAQAVAARTESLAKLAVQHYGENFDLCASQHCQEYAGVTRASARTDEAVRETRGIALMTGGRFVDAVYSANCGGHTEHNNNVWTANPNPSLRGVLDAPKQGVPFASPLTPGELRRWLSSHPQAYCGDPRIADLEKFRWRVRYSAAELDRRVNQHYRVGRVREIRLGERGVSGRLQRVDIIGDTDRVTVRKELNIRRVFGGLRSAMFVLDVDRDALGKPTRYTFLGGGWGHGVGLCQNGAMGMALEGFKYPAILVHYFQGSYLQRIYE